MIYAPPLVETEEQPAGEPYPALVALLEQAEARLEAARDDDEWVTHFLIWLELHRLLMSKGQAIDHNYS